MPNPYDEIFEENSEQRKPQSKPSEFSSLQPEEDEGFHKPGKEPLEEILEGIQRFQKEAEPFSQLLTSTKAIDHKVSNKIARFFLVESNPEKKKTLKEERGYHDLLQNKFERIIKPMRQLAEIHLDIVKQFNRDIDKNYYSVEKEDITVKSDISFSVKSLNMQRKILADAAGDLEMLEGALTATERRLKAFIDAGGINNISRAEFEILSQKRTTLTKGRRHQFNYSFFNINLLDETAISLGIYMKETTSQYIGKLMKVFEVR